MTPAADGTATSDITAPRAALVALAAALDPREFVTTLTTGPGRRPCLSVASRHAKIGDDICADHRAYYWSWVLQASSACRMTLHRTAPRAAFATRLHGCGARRRCCSDARRLRTWPLAQHLWRDHPLLINLLTWYFRENTTIWHGFDPQRTWAERIAPVADPQAAARKISSVLRAVPEPTHG